MIYEIVLFMVTYTFIVASIGAWLDRKTRKVNFFELTHNVSMREGKKKNVNQAQINEIVKIVLDELGIKGRGK